MTDIPTRSELIELVKHIDLTPTSPTHICHPPHVWIYELQKHPENFYRDSNGELLYLGCQIVVLDDDGQFAEMANQMIK